MDILDRMLEYDAWIMRRMLAYCRELSDEQLQQHFDIGWETIHATLVHVVANMELWNDMLHGRVPHTGVDPRNAGTSIDELASRHAAVAGELAAFARQQASRGNLDGIMVDILYDPPAENTYGTVLCDIFHENMVHRSEIRHMLHRLHVPPLDTYDPLSWESEMEKQTPRLGLRSPR